MTAPNVGIWSLFRDDAGENIARYRRRVSNLDYPADKLRFYLVEGDSKDGTLDELRAWAVEDGRVNITVHNTGLSRMRHTPHQDRLDGLSATGNAALDLLTVDNWAEYALLIESDLIYEPDVLKRLLAHLPDNAGGISPFIWIPGDEDHLQFYDVWAFRTLDGAMFPPYMPAWYMARFPDAPFEVESAGSMVLFKAQPFYSGVRYDSKAIRGICLQLRDKGLPVHADPTTHIFHPFVLHPYPLIENGGK